MPLNSCFLRIKPRETRLRMRHIMWHRRRRKTRNRLEFGLNLESICLRQSNVILYKKCLSAQGMGMGMGERGEGWLNISTTIRERKLMRSPLCLGQSCGNFFFFQALFSSHHYPSRGPYPIRVPLYLGLEETCKQHSPIRGSIAIVALRGCWYCCCRIA